jgi:hypothetical protein
MFKSKLNKAFSNGKELNPILTRIILYPVKSLDGITVDRVRISPGGALMFDRQWAIADERGKIVNGKRTAQIQRLRSQFNLDLGLISLRVEGSDIAETFKLETKPNSDLARWLTNFFQFPVTLVENATNGFPDDTHAYGPTIVSTATLELVGSWFQDLDASEVRRRFRTNLEISGVPAWWEDRLFGNPNEIVNFAIGQVSLAGINPCQRCVVPTRNSLTGKDTDRFQRLFTQHRQHTLPDWVNSSRFNHFYRLAVNTQIPVSEAGKSLQIGDRLTEQTQRIFDQ